MAYTTNEIATNAVKQLQDSLSGLKINNLDSYVSQDLKDAYAPYMNYKDILGKYDDAATAAYDLAKQEQIQAMNAAESSNYANTKSGIKSLRDALVGSASSGANVGAANATALQALLGLGQTNSAATTTAMQGYQNAAKEMAAAKAQNAVTALESAKSGLDSMYGQATSAYNSDHLYGVQGAAEGVGTIGSTVDTNATNERMNDATNATNIKVAQTPTTQTIYNRTKKG